MKTKNVREIIATLIRFHKKQKHCLGIIYKTVGTPESRFRLAQLKLKHTVDSLTKIFFGARSKEFL